MRTSFTLDYISATTKSHSIKQVMDRFAFGIHPDGWITTRARNGYEFALKHPLGHVISWSTARDDMGINVLFSGIPLAELHGIGVNTLQIVYWMYEEEFKFARLDFAIDCRDVHFDLEALQACERSGSVNKEPILIKNGAKAQQGSTLYVGSWQSEKFIRIYDKGAMQSPPQQNWFRFELEVKSKTASKIAKMIYNLDDVSVGRIAQGVMLHMFKPHHADYLEVMKAEPVKVASTKNTEHATYDWLMHTVSKTLARVILELPHRDVIGTFEGEVRKHMEELLAKSLSQTP